MTRTVALVGSGVVGGRIEKRLQVVSADVEVELIDPRIRRLNGFDVAVLACPGPHAPLAAALLERGTAVLSIEDAVDEVRALLDLDPIALDAGVPLVVGAGMSPGLTDLLARYLADRLASCDEIHLAVHGTAGPACARRHHRALGGRAVGLRDGVWIDRTAGSGRELCWFPEPVGAYDCYLGELATPLLLHEAFPEVGRISARISATRRDRFTAWLPMLSPPHGEGGVGAVRVEVRGDDADGARRTLVAGIAELVGTAAAATATAFTAALLDGSLPPGVVVPGSVDLDTIALLREIERLGVRIQEFTGIPTA